MNVDRLQKSPPQGLGRKIAGALFPPLLMAVALAGCSLRYYDAGTGTDHVWGFGHIKTRVTVPEEGRLAVASGRSLYGIAIGTDEEGGYFSLGWDSRERVIILDENTKVRLEFPAAGIFDVRVGAKPPPPYQWTKKEKNTKAVRNKKTESERKETP